MIGHRPAGCVNDYFLSLGLGSLGGDQHNANAELLAQGVANIAAPIVGGIPVTGAIACTATNYRSGAKTPIAGIGTAASVAREMKRASGPRTRIASRKWRTPLRRC